MSKKFLAITAVIVGCAVAIGYEIGGHKVAVIVGCAILIGAALVLAIESAPPRR